MNVSGRRSLIARGAGVALVGALISPLSVSAAQEALPKVQLTQIVDPQFGYGNDARVRLDRDAFLVIIEFGADRRARIVYPESPRDTPYTSGRTQMFVPLPSADAMFVRTARVMVPTLVAIASDLSPDLSTFTASGREWDFDYEIPRGTSRLEMVRALAAIMYGGEDMPYSFELQELAPQLSPFAINALNSCGYLFASEISPGFNNFLWQTFGPYPLGFFPNGGFSPWSATMGGGARFGLFPIGFRRYVDSGLWGQFGAGCGALRGQRFFFAIAEQPGPGDTPPDNGDEVALAPRPRDRDPLARPPVVPDVGILTASPSEQARRGSLVAEATEKATAAKPGTPTRTEAEQLVQRSQVLDFIRRVSAQQALGLNGSRVAAENGGYRRVQRGSGSTGSYGGVGRTSSGGGRTTVGSSGGEGSSGGSSGSVGSGSSSGGSAGRGGSAGGGRSGSGGRVPPR